VIGGSGLYAGAALDDAQQIAGRERVRRALGPGDDGLLEGRALHLHRPPRRGHRPSPAQVNYRANIDVLKRCGVTDVLAISAVGSLREKLAPGDFVAVDQLVDRTTGRERSFFGPGLVAHVGMADPTCPRLSDRAARAARAAGVRAHRSGCYVAIDGPQFSTRAESALYRQWGADVIGMTAMPEARLAREAELPYALLGMVTDYDCWREGGDVDAATILAVMRANAEAARTALRHLAVKLPAERPDNPLDRALDQAIVTPRAHWTPQAVARLDAVAAACSVPSRDPDHARRPTACKAARAGTELGSHDRQPAPQGIPALPAVDHLERRERSYRARIPDTIRPQRARVAGHGGARRFGRADPARAHPA
jgi:5'-methylthioadenosine phosphorylase